LERNYENVNCNILEAKREFLRGILLILEIILILDHGEFPFTKMDEE